MKIIKSVGLAWSLLTMPEKRGALACLSVMIVAALASALMVASVVPFLAVLSEINLIHEVSILAWIYDTGGFQSNYGFLIALGGAVIVVICVASLILIASTWLITRYTFMRVHSISSRLMEHYLAQPYQYFLQAHSTNMSTNILMETQQVVQQYMRPLADLISSLLTIFAVVLTLFIFDPFVAFLVMFTFVPLFGSVLIMSRRYVARMGRLRVSANTSRTRVLGEALSGIKALKLANREAYYLDRFDTPSINMAKAEVGVNVISQIPRYAIQMFVFSGLVLLCLFMLDPQKIDDGTAMSSFLPVIGLLAFAGQRLMPELQKLFGALTLLTAGNAALKHIVNELSTGEQAVIDRSVLSAMGLRNRFDLESISYTHPNADRPSVKSVSLSISAGERIGIVGSSGAGKTTLADIILGLLVPHDGKMRSDGQKIDHEKLNSWRQTVGYVPQEIYIMDATLAQNIAFGLADHDIDQDKVKAAARGAQLHDFAIYELPEGYNTPMGERGIRLSGGQRQRIGIARALYNETDLIVFDEATSALDYVTERDVMAAIDGMTCDKTIILIAHRLSTIKNCDRIVVMEQGQIVDVGTWSDLETRSAPFKRLLGATDRKVS